MKTTFAIILFFTAMATVLVHAEIPDELQKHLKTIKYDTILQNHDKDFGTKDTKHFKQDLLIFVTPWNNKGFDLTVKYAKKINYIAPVWFNLKSQTSIKGHELLPELTGAHDVRRDYIQNLKAENPDIKVLPRVYLEVTSEQSFSIFQNREQMDFAIEVILSLFKQFPEFDGILFDSPIISFIGRARGDIKYFLEELGNRLRAENKLYFISTMANGLDLPLKKTLYPILLNIADKFLLGTYDNTKNYQQKIPISPIQWLREEYKVMAEQSDVPLAVVEEKLMLGIPFYGYETNFGSQKREVITNDRYLQILRDNKPKIGYLDALGECFFEIRYRGDKTNTQFMYPCLKFIDARLKLFEDLQVGGFVWEGGQGLDYFYGLF